MGRGKGVGKQQGGNWDRLSRSPVPANGNVPITGINSELKINLDNIYSFEFP